MVALLDLSLTPEATAALIGAAVGALGSWGLAAVTDAIRSRRAADRERRVAALLIMTELTTIGAALSALRAVGTITHPLPNLPQAQWQAHGKALLYGADLTRAGIFASAYSQAGDVAVLCNEPGHDFVSGPEAQTVDSALEQVVRAIGEAGRLSGQLSDAEIERRLQAVREHHTAPAPSDSPAPDPGPSDGLVVLMAATDVVLEAVEAAAQPTTQHLGRDVNDALLGAAYGRAYRCMRSIRQLAARGEADDAVILARALVSLVGRSLYLVAPDDLAERRTRFERALLTWGEAMLRAADDLEAAGFDHDADRDRLARIVADAKQRGVAKLPNDRDILDTIGLGNYYVRIYRLASEVAHYSIGSALDGFVEYPRSGVGGGRVALRMPDSDRAEEALTLGLITYGVFLERTEPVLGHGVAPIALRVVTQLRDTNADGIGAAT